MKRSPERIGFVGLGNMGRPLAARLAGAGVQLGVFDQRADVVRSFAAQYGGQPAGSLAALARHSDVVITMLPTGDAVNRVVLGAGRSGEDRLLDGLGGRAVLIDMGSSSPIGTQRLGQALAEHDLSMLDAPVSGGVKRAEAGTLSIMVGGESAVVEACRPLLALMGAQIFTTGPLGSAHAMKALNNLVSAAGLIAAAEAVLIGRRFGLDPALMVDVLNASTGRNNATENKFKQFILSRTFDSGFSLALMVKDLTTAIELVEHAGTAAPFSGMCKDLWVCAQAELEESADHTAVVRWFEKQAGVTLAKGE